MRRYLNYSVLLAAFLLSCSPDYFLKQERPVNTILKYNNPHTVCVGCHVSENPQPGTALFNPETDPSSICENCHQYRQDHHPVEFAPANSPDALFPLYDGQVKCLTCHEIHGGPEHEGTSKLLRGGPYPDRRTICFKCHANDQYAKINPHDMLDAAGKIKEVNGKPVCLVCHAVQPDPSVDWSDDVRFRADVGFLCWRCHPPMPGEFFTQHFLVTPTVSRQYMQEAEERFLVILPLVPRDRITCSTCHNPHEKGVIQHEAAAKGADARYRLRLPSICAACHPV
jgi:predicted CXXCH cytochrome family protein